MALNTRHFNILPYPPRLNKAAEKLTQFQADFVSDALRRAVEDAGAAMAHQLSEPLTTLLLYLHGIKQVGRPCEGTETVPASVREMVNMALRATERVWEIMEQVGPFEAPADAEVVVPVPDSGVPAALGYAQAAGIPYELGIIRNHYVGRTFIQPTQSIRELGVRMKHNANRAVIAGKRIVLIDDSLVRGTTSVKIVRMMREAGAKEVHFRIASPPITHPDYYGIDTPERDKLLAAVHDLEGMRRLIDADSLAFLSVDGLYRAMGEARRDPARPQFTDHCFTGEYPTPLTDRMGQEALPRQLSLLAEAS